MLEHPASAAVARWWAAIKNEVGLLDVGRAGIHKGRIEFQAGVSFALVIERSRCRAIEGPVSQPDCVVAIDPSALHQMLEGLPTEPARPVFRVSGDHALFRAVFAALEAHYRPAHSPWSAALRRGSR